MFIADYMGVYYMILTMLNIGNMRYDHQPIYVHDWLYTYDRLMLMIKMYLLYIHTYIYITLYNQSYDH